MSQPTPNVRDIDGLIEDALGLEICLTPDDSTRLLQLRDLIVRYNKRINVIARCTPAEAAERHVLDSLCLRRLLDRRAELAPKADPSVIYDVGSGGGFPGLVLAVVYPDVHVHMVEPIGKKGALVSQAARLLGIGNATMHTCRLDAMPAPQGPCWAVSRATFAPQDWASLGKEYVGPGGAVVVMQGGDQAVDVEGILTTDRFTLPSGAGRINSVILA